MGPSGPVSINILAVGYILDHIEVDDKVYFINKLRQLVNAKIAKMIESSSDGKT